MPLIEGTMVVGCVANGFLLTVSDWCAQMVERGVRKGEKDDEESTVEPYDLRRTIRFAGIGVFLTGPLTYTRYAVLGGLFGYGATGGVALQKALFNQLLFDPPETAVHLASIEYLRSRDVEKMKSKVKADYWSVQIPSWGLAIPVNIATFTLFPFVWQQMIFQRTISTCFNVYFSYIANRSLEDADYGKAKSLCENNVLEVNISSVSVSKNSVITKKDLTSKITHRRRFRRRYTTRKRDRSSRRADDLKRPTSSTNSFSLLLLRRNSSNNTTPRVIHKFIGSSLDEPQPSKWKATLTSWSTSFMPSTKTMTAARDCPSRA